MSTLEYLSLSKTERAAYKFGHFFVAIGLGIANFFKKFPKRFVNFFKKIIHPFRNLGLWFARGDALTKLSFIFMGFGQLFRKQVLRGFFTFLYEIVAIFFVIFTGVPNFIKLPTFGYVGSAQYEIDEPPFIGYKYSDNSFMILLNSIFAIVIIFIFIFLWYTSIRDSYKSQQLAYIGKPITDKDTIKNIGSKQFHKVLLTVPTTGIVIFTIIPIIFMICIGFTNYNSDHMQPKELFDWVGLNNFGKLFGATETGGAQFASVFAQILVWTLVWAFFATFTNYFLGMVVAIMINNKAVKGKKIWRTILITTIAVPQFVSLLLMSKMLNENTGIINNLLLDWGIISAPIKWLTNGILVKVTIILVNMWVGIPYTMLMCTGILMNIPEDLYESAKIDGANPFKMYMKITLPYMLFVTTPYLISSFVGNINNFNVIYLLSSGGPVFTSVNGEIITERVFGAGQSDLLITWLYKMSMGEVYKDYGASSVIGLMIFVVVAFLSLIFYGRSNAVKNEEDFQ